MPPCRVELLPEACDDLDRLKQSGNHLQFLKKLMLIEKDCEAGALLGRELVGWRKLTVGNRDWRIIYKPSDGVALIAAIGDRSDSEVYRLASERLQKGSRSHATQMLSEVMLEIIEREQEKRRAARRSR